jgi:hypothetical protein
MRRHLSLPLVLAVSLAVAACSGPVGPFAGGELSGDVHPGAVADWEFAADVETIQLETNPADPYSVNTWIGVMNGSAYIPTSLILGAENPEERQWVRNVQADNRARVRVAGKVYAVRLERVLESTELAAARSLLMSKYAEDATEQSDAAWIYRLQPP